MSLILINQLPQADALSGSELTIAYQNRGTRKVELSAYGQGNNNYKEAGLTDNSTLLGGLQNFVGCSFGGNFNAEYSIVGGGCANKSSGYNNVVGGGRCNFTSIFNNASGSAIGGGKCNVIEQVYGVTLGGNFNRVQHGTSGADKYGVVAGGGCNCVSSSYGTIGGGINNRICDGIYSSIVNGCCNCATGQFDFIGTGCQNCTCQNVFSCKNFVFLGTGRSLSGSSTYATVINGCQNSNRGCSASIAGGKNNCINSWGFNSFIGGGTNNSQCGFAGLYTAVIGGSGNDVAGNASSIVGGKCNIIGGGIGNFMGGGYNHSMTTAAKNRVIFGGENNNTTSNYGFVGGGQDNRVSRFSPISLVVGGSGNHICGDGQLDVIVGGRDNCICNLSGAFVGGGCFNNIYGGTGNVIVGGKSNTLNLNTSGSFIGAGTNNQIVSGYGGGIVGGSNNIIKHDQSFIVGSNMTSVSSCMTHFQNLHLSADAMEKFDGVAASSFNVPTGVIFLSATKTPDVNILAIRNTTGGI